MRKEDISITKIQEKAKEQLDKLMYSGNTREMASFVQSVAAVLNEKDNENTQAKEKSKEDKEKSKEVTIYLLLFGIIRAGDG